MGFSIRFAVLREIPGQAGDDGRRQAEDEGRRQTRDEEEAPGMTKKAKKRMGENGSRE